MLALSLALLLLSLALLLLSLCIAQGHTAVAVAAPPRVAQSATSRSGCCVPPRALTFDACAASHPCASGRDCVTDDTLHACALGRSCICYPRRVHSCSASSQCATGELCAARPYDHFAFCVSELVVSLDPSFVLIQQCCEQQHFPVQLPVVSTPLPTVTATATAVPTRTADATPTRTATATAVATPTRTVVVATVTVTVTATAVATTTVTATATATAITTTTVTATATATRTIAPTPTREPTRQPTPSRQPTPTRLTQSPQPQITAVQPSPTRVASPAPQTRPPKSSPGLAGDRCARRGECIGYRKCVESRSLRECSAGDDCVCVGSRLCVCNDQCTDGELCSGAPGRAYCFSPRLIESLPYANALPCPLSRPTPSATGSATATATGGATRQPRPSTTGLTGESCRIDKNCAGSRRCVAARSDSCVSSGVLCDGRQQACSVADRVCYCFRLDECNCSRDCDDDERCVATRFGRICISPLLPDSDALLQTIGCPSSTAGATADDPILIVNLVAPENVDAQQQSSSDSAGDDDDDGDGAQGAAEDAVCVDARALRHLPPQQLLYSSHRRARVLCDAQLSCATPGHVVLFRGRAMMMKTYCRRVGSCEARVMRVNSPRLRVRVRVASNTPGLHFTAFAARYETRAEELALSTVVHVGL